MCPTGEVITWPSAHVVASIGLKLALEGIPFRRRGESPPMDKSFLNSRRALRIPIQPLWATVWLYVDAVAAQGAAQKVCAPIGKALACSQLTPTTG